LHLVCEFRESRLIYQSWIPARAGYRQLGRNDGEASNRNRNSFSLDLFDFVLF
jgi:hypothetical protein